LVLQVEKRDREAIRSDSNASLTTEGLLGNRYVSISRGFKGTVIQPGGEIPSKPSLLLTLKDSMHFFDKTLDCLQQGKTQWTIRRKLPPNRRQNLNRDKSQVLSG